MYHRFLVSILNSQQFYRQEYFVVEKSFDNLKNDIDMRRLYVQRDEIAEGKMFVAFIAPIVRTYMQNRVRLGEKICFSR